MSCYFGSRSTFRLWAQGNILISSNSLPRVPSLGPHKGGVDLGIAQYADKLAAVNRLHSKQGPQVHLLGAGTYFGFGWACNAEFATINSPNFRRLDI
jgi:hypothetical protein